MSQQNKIIKEIFNQTAQRIVSSSKELYQFLLQNRYMYELPITKIIEIYGQNQNVTRLKTFNEWQALRAKVIKGQTGIPTLNEPDSDLLTNPEEVWDIEIIEFEVAPEVDLHHIASQLDDLGLAYYVDKKGKILTLTDGQNLEIWFMK